MKGGRCDFDLSQSTWGWSSNQISVFVLEMLHLPYYEEMYKFPSGSFKKYA